MSSNKDRQQRWNNVGAGVRSHDHASRLLALLRLFHHRGSVTRGEIIAELSEWYGVNPDRTLRRDIAALAGRDLEELSYPPDEPPPHGFDIRHDRIRDRFSLVSSDLMPRLTQEEHETLQAVRHALEGDPLLGRQVEKLSERLAHDRLYLTPPSVWLNLGLATDYTPHEGTLVRLVKAIEEQRSISFEYISSKSTEPRRHRKVDVYPLELTDGHYYVDGYHHEADTFITYRIDRIVPGSLRILPEYGTRRQRSKPLLTVSYWLSPTLVAGGVSRRLLDQCEELALDGGVIVTGKARSLFHVQRLLLGYGALAKALAPPELRAALTAETERMVALYRRAPAREE